MGIVEEIRQNRESGARRLQSEYQAGLMTLARGFCVDESDAEELVNRTFAAVVNGIDGYLAQSSFFTWMCKIMRNIHATDGRRRSNRDIVYLGELPETADEEAFEAIYRDLDSSLVRDALALLSDDQREAIILHYFLDVPIAKMAKILAVPTGTVSSRLHYARKALTAKLFSKVNATAKKPGGKAILLALALAALTAVGAVGVAAIRYAAGLGAQEAEVVSNAEGAEGAEGSLTGLTGFEEAGGIPQSTNHESLGSQDSEANGGSTGQVETTTAISETNSEEDTMNIQSFKSAAVKTLAAGAMLAAGAAQGFDCYVATGGSDVTGNGSSGNPYATISNALEKANTAIAGGDTSATIHVADGTYMEHSLTLANPITIVGESGDRDAVIIDANASNANQRRAFTLNHAAATLSGVTVRNGYLWSLAGGNILIDASGGVVTNCVVLNGLGVGGGNISLKGASSLVVDCVVTNGSVRWSQGGNIHASGGRVSRCFVAMGKVTNPDDKAYGDSGNVYLGNSAVIENCLIMGGVTKRDKATYANGVYLADNSRMVNCTIVNNRSDSCPNVPAVNAGASTVRVVNCVIYDNGGTVAREWGGANGACYINCAVAADVAITGGTDNIATLADAAFENYVNGDYRPSIGSVLVDAGCDPSSYVFGCTPDPDGVGRPSGAAWDIGCYEFDWSSVSVGVTFAASTEKSFVGETVTFTPQVFGADGPFTFKWNFDDGAGDEISSSVPMAHAFATAGLHYPTISVSVDGGLTWAASFTASVPVQTAPAVMWLDATNASPVYPYATEATAATNLVDVLNVLTNAAGALAMDGVTVKVKPGTYVGKSYPEITVGLTILGVGARDEIVFDAKASRNNQGRVFTLNHADATLSGVTVMNGYLWDLVGGNILIDASGGVATNCVVLNGMGVGGGNISLKGASSLVVDCVVTNGSVRWSQGGNIIASDGRVSHCLVSAGKVNEPYEKTAGDSGNVYLGGSAIMENCLVMGGATAGNKATYANGVYLAGNSRMVNCTIVKNRSDSCPDVPAVNAGASTVRAVNCVIYDNGDSVAREWGGANGACYVNCAVAADAGITGGTGNVATLEDTDFKDYANGDYRPAKGGVLVNAGTKWADYLSFGATSEADLEGAVRLSGRFLDIGCYEIASGVGLSIFVR